MSDTYEHPINDNLKHRVQSIQVKPIFSSHLGYLTKATYFNFSENTFLFTLWPYLLLLLLDQTWPLSQAVSFSVKNYY